MSKNKNNIDIKYIGVPNICFSLTKENDKREEDFIKQRLERGFDDSETWALSDTFANFMIPRLERYIVITDGFLNLTDDHKNNIQDFLTAMKLVARDNGIQIYTDEEQKQLEKGLDAFPKILMSLWW